MLCIENRLDCELEGVRVGLVLAGEESDPVYWLKLDVRGEGVLPYGLAVRKLYAGSM